MSKYYRAEDVECEFPTIILNSAIRPMHIDDWHPASQPPTDKDFEPTGWLQVRYVIGGIVGFTHITAGQIDDFGLTRGATHWRKITPPKQ